MYRTSMMQQMINAGQELVQNKELLEAWLKECDIQYSQLATLADDPRFQLLPDRKQAEFRWILDSMFVIHDCLMESLVYSENKIKCM